MVIQIAEHFFTMTQAAEELKVERHTIWRWVKAGRLDAQRVGRVSFVERKAIEDLKKK